MAGNILVHRVWVEERIPAVWDSQEEWMES